MEINTILEMFDFWDFLIMAVLVVGLAYYLFNKYSAKSDPYAPSFSPIAPQTTQGQGSFVDKMKNGGRTVCVFYGSQTGTAEELAGRLAKETARYGIKASVFDPEECDMDLLSEVSEIENNLVIFCVATYGEGDPTDNCQELNEFLQRGEADLTNINYAVFGLGNKTYEHYNAMGKFVDTSLHRLGGTRVFELGMGDDDGNLEEDFMRWKESFWPAVCDHFNLEVVGTDDMSTRQYKVTLLTDYNANSLFTGEITRLGSFRRQRPPYDHKNPFMSNIVVNRELHKAGDRSCKHIEFDLTDSRLRYEAGDHVAVFPENKKELVQKFSELLSVNLDTVFTLTNLDEDSSKKHPFPCPCTFRTALTHYVDIQSPLRSHVLKELAEYSTDEEQKKYLQLLSSASEDGLHEYHRYIQEARRSILDILTEFPSCKPDLDHLLELLPRLQARYYSISSSPKQDPTRLSITSVVVKYSKGNRLIEGVATNYLKDKISIGEHFHAVPIFIRKSTLRLPHRSNVPVIMIGPGTGLAPFRGFIQDRAKSKDQGHQIGTMVMYFGCRNSQEDFIYEDELTHWKDEGVISELHLAFSREQEKKVYVQNRLWENNKSTWELLKNGAHVYVCGDARHMARDVQNTFIRIAKEVGGMLDKEAEEFIADMEKQKRYQADVWS